jgi:hypothetical protein
MLRPLLQADCSMGKSSHAARAPGKYLKYLIFNLATRADAANRPVPAA